MLMAVKKVYYYKKFVPKTEEKSLKINDEDAQIRQEIQEKFAFDIIDEWRGKGFDGKMLYRYHIGDNLYTKKSSENVEYQTDILITKAGEENIICFYSELEKLLVKNNFRQLE
jgi:hypothetical protein